MMNCMQPEQLNLKNYRLSEETMRTKNILTLTLILIFSLGATQAFADDHDDGRRHDGGAGGGYTGSGPAPVTVQRAKSMWDDSRVVLKGCITRSLGGEYYEFTDATGAVTVEIDHHTWQGLNIGPDDLVEIHGEVDNEWTGTEIDVKRIIKR